MLHPPSGIRRMSAAPRLRGLQLDPEAELYMLHPPSGHRRISAGLDGRGPPPNIEDVLLNMPSRPRDRQTSAEGPPRGSGARGDPRAQAASAVPSSHGRHRQAAAEVSTACRSQTGGHLPPFDATAPRNPERTEGWRSSSNHAGSAHQRAPPNDSEGRGRRASAHDRSLRANDGRSRRSGCLPNPMIEPTKFLREINGQRDGSVSGPRRQDRGGMPQRGHGVMGGPGRLVPPRDVFQSSGAKPMFGGQLQKAGACMPGYTLVRPLITGGMSQAVNVVKHQRTGTLYVEKRVSTQGCMRGRAYAELRTLQRTRGGPNLNQLAEHLMAEQQGFCTFILEHCDASSLDEIIRHSLKARMLVNEKVVWHTITGIARALAYLHWGIWDPQKDEPNSSWNTICHLDLKPSNVFFSHEGQEGQHPRVVLGDFGCSVAKSDIEFGMVSIVHPSERRRAGLLTFLKEHPRKQMAGTPIWCPPEGLPEAAGRRRTSYGPQTDVW